ncbi:MAG: TonB-dependent siderophore receptor [Puniceicoccaceae bacterium]
MKTQTIRRGLLTAGVLVLASGLTGILNAQANDEEDDVIDLAPFEVSVEGRDRYLATNQIGGTRLQTPVQELPMSIQIVPDTLIRDMAVFEIEDSLRFVSGVSLSNRNDLDNAGESYVIRGFSTQMLLRNGIPFNAFTDSIIVQQVEVVKGPSSVLYGVSDPGGLVNTVTKRPLDEARYYVGTHIGSWDRYRAEYDFTGPLDSEGKVAYRLMGSWEDKGDFRPHVDDEKIFTDLVLSFRPNKQHRILVEYMMGEENNQANSRRGYPVLKPAPRQFADLGYKFMNGGPNDYQDLEQDLIDLTWEAQWNSNIRSRVAYTHTNRSNDKFSNAQSVINKGKMNKLPQREMYDFDQDNLFVDLVADYRLGESRHTTLAGLQHRTDDWEFSNFLWKDVIGPPILFNDKVNPTDFDPNQSEEERYWMPPLDEMVWVANPLGENAPTIIEEERTGYFVSHQARFLDDQLRFMAGLRYDELEFGRNDSLSGLASDPDFNLASNSSWSQTTPQIGMNYEFMDGLAFYVGYNESFVPNTPGTDILNGETVLFVPEPQEGKAIEAGFKYELFERKVVGTLAIFDIEKTNVVSYNKGRDIDDPIWILSPYLEAKGVEFDAIWSPNKNLQIIFAYAYHDAKEADIATGALIRQLQGASKNNVSSWIRYQYTDGPLNGLSLGGGFEWKDGPINLFPNAGKTKHITQDSYATLDFFVRYSRMLNDRVNMSVSLNVKNAADEIYMNKTAYFADPRNYMASVSFTW